MDSAFWDAVAAIAAVIAVAGGGVSWWQANASRAARVDAEHAKDLAERQAAAAEDQAKAAGEQAATAVQQVAHLEGLLEESSSQSESLGRLADSVEGAWFKIEYVRGQMYQLLNRTSTEETVEHVTNRTSFAILKDLPDGTKLPARSGVNFRMMAANGAPLPPTMELELVGRSGPTYVDVPPKPRK